MSQSYVAPIPVRAEKSTEPQELSNTEESLGSAAPAGVQPPAFTWPDGGWEAWGVVAGGWLTLFATFGYLNAFGVYQEYYVTQLKHSQSAISWIGSFQFWLLFTMGVVVGPIFDEGHTRLLMLTGSAFYIVAIFTTSVCTKYWQIFLAQGVLAGIGLGILFMPALAIVNHWFKRRHSLATGIVFSGSSIGGVCFPIMLNHLFYSPTVGFKGGVRASGYVVVGCLVFANLLIKSRIPPRKLRPAHMQFPAPDVKAILRHKAYLVTTAGIFLITLGAYFPLFYLQVFTVNRGMSNSFAFYTIAITNAASAAGRILPNFLADIFGPFNMLIAATAAAGVILFCWLPVHTEGGVIAFAILYGFMSGTYVGLAASLYRSLSSHVGEVGIRLGIAWAVIAVAALVGTPINGALLGPESDWTRPTVFSGVCVLAGTATVFVARCMHARALGREIL